MIDMSFRDAECAAWKSIGPVALHTELQHWPLKRPLRITGHTFYALDVLLVSLRTAMHVGKGEAAGVFRRNDNVNFMIDQIEELVEAQI
jgi:muconate cycloisomerase